MKMIELINHCKSVLLWICFLSLLAPFAMNADSRGGYGFNGCFYDGGWIATISGKDYVVAAVDYNYYNTSGNNSDYVGIVSIKSSLSSGKQVYYIGDKAFKNGRNMTYLSIPGSVKWIKSGAFSQCYGLKVLLESHCIFDAHLNYNCTLYAPEGEGARYQSVCSKVIDGFTANGQLFSGSGSGTKNDPYLVFNPMQLNQMRHFLGEKYVHFKLMSDIDLSEWLADNNPSQGWQPIGTESSPFMGIFEGNNHKITGLRISRPSTDDVGFWGYMLWAEVSDLTIDNSEIKGNNNVGLMAGRAIDCDIENCSVDGTVRASGDNAGGFLGCGSGHILGCTSNGTIIGNNRIGGFVGSLYDGQGSEFHFDNCTFVGEVNGDNNLAGCVGYTDHDLYIANFRSMGNIFSNGNYVGGIVGYSCGEELEIKETYSLCDIISHGDYAGGIAGYWLTRDYPSPNYTPNLANFSTKDSYYNGIMTIDGSYIGGILGYANCRDDISPSKCNINMCYSYANIIGDSYVGGIAGEAPGSNISSNVSICGLISAVTGNVGRVYGSDDLSGVTLGECGTANENKGFARASVLLNGIAQELPDGLKHGTNVGNATLKYGATYQGMGWDFNDWTIIETESYPYKAIQCAPPIVTSTIEANATEISGNCTEDGTVTVVANGEEYITQSTDHQWTVQVSPLQAGSVVKVQADTEDKLPSYFVLNTVAFGGNGTESDPYSIYTADDLQNINSYAYYRLKADIDLTEWINNNNPAGGWIPIGASGNATMKQLDGNGHKITGLWCNNDLENCGLFATTNNAIIRDLTLCISDGKNVKGGQNTGCVVGFAKGTQFENITVYGDIEGQQNVGGIIGFGSRDDSDRYETSLKHCSFYGSVTGDTYVGGLVGQSASVVSECYSQGTITGNNTTCYVGGIVGNNRFYIADCYSSANVVAGKVDNSIPISDRNQYAGGIAGDNGHTVIHCYSSGNLYAVKCAAGIAGYNTSEVANVYQCFAMNRKIEVADASGIAMRVIGGIRNGAPAPEANNYALKTMVVSVNNVPQTIYDDLLQGQSLTEGALRKEATYRDNGWDMVNVWKIDEDRSYPYLRAIHTQSDVERGDVDGDSSIDISDVTKLIDYVLSGNASGVNLESADCDQDGRIDISDVTTLIDFLLWGNW